VAPASEPKFKIGDRATAFGHIGTVVAVGWTPMAEPTAVYRLKLEYENPWATDPWPRPISSGPYGETVLPGLLKNGERDFHETYLTAYGSAVDRLGDLVRPGQDLGRTRA